MAYFIQPFWLFLSCNLMEFSPLQFKVFITKEMAVNMAAEFWDAKVWKALSVASTPWLGATFNVKLLPMLPWAMLLACLCMPRPCIAYPDLHAGWLDFWIGLGHLFNYGLVWWSLNWAWVVVRPDQVLFRHCGNWRTCQRLLTLLVL